MVRRFRPLLVTVWLVTILLVAAATLALTMATGSQGGRPLVVQPRAANAAADTPIPAAPETTTTVTTVAPTTVAPTTVPPTTAAPTTEPPATASPVTAAPVTAPRVVPATVAAPPVTAPPATAAPVKAVSGGGSAGDYSLIGYRWNPCQAVTFSSSGPDISGVVAELASITGLHLQVVGSGGEVTVAWGAVSSGGEVGVTSWRAVGAWLTGGTIVISPQAQPYIATVLRHELAHSLGLGHASQANEVMYPTAGPGSPTDYQAGDLTGLHAVGTAAGGC
jgi:hypothetical protein